MKILIVITTILGLAPALDGQASDAGAHGVWREYAYPVDNFAITLPSEPTPHKDVQLPDLPITVYTSGGVTLRVESTSGGCDFAITDQLKMIEEVKTGQRKPDPAFRLDSASVRHGDLEGYPFLEFEQTVGNTNHYYERWYCAVRRLYMFSAAWPIGQPKPRNVGRIVRSFRFLKKQ